jgi:hypothetical protein
VERLWIFLGVFAVAFPYLYRRLRRERERGVANAGEGLARDAEKHMAGTGLVIASILVLAAIAEGSAPVLALAVLLFALALWRLRAARET